MNRVFLLGDSFTDNLYQVHIFNKRLGKIDSGNQVRKYVDIVFEQTNKYPMYFDEWLKYWGYDVFNFGLGGCSIYHTFNQFAKIDKKFKKGDRIIVGWTSPQRLDWLVDNGDVQIIQGAYNNYINKPDVWQALQEQDILRADSLDNRDSNGYIRKQTIPFMSRLVDLHSKYNPIQWSPFANVSDIFTNEPWYMYEPTNPIFKDYIKDFNKLLIEEESEGVCRDRHHSRYGNYYLALIFKTIIEYKNYYNEYYIQDDKLQNLIFETLLSSKPNFEPVKWRKRSLFGKL